MSITPTLERVLELTPEFADNIIAIFPEDKLKNKRCSNLRKSYYVLVARVDGEIAGVVFIRRLLFVPNATWIVAMKFQRHGIALHLLQRAKKENPFITALSRNTASVNLAQKAGFWVLPFGIGIWQGRAE